MVKTLADPVQISLGWKRSSSSRCFMSDEFGLTEVELIGVVTTTVGETGMG